jgi:hypothetical protein
MSFIIGYKKTSRRKFLFKVLVFLCCLYFLRLCWNWIVPAVLGCLCRTWRIFLQWLLLCHKFRWRRWWLRRLFLFWCLCFLLVLCLLLLMCRHKLLWCQGLLGRFLCLLLLFLVLGLDWFCIDRGGWLMLLGLCFLLLHNSQ